MQAREPIASIIQHSNPTISGAFYLPSGADKERFLDFFFLEYGEFTPIYQEPSALARHIRAAGTVLKYTLDKLYATLSLQYNPIENYDRQEEWSDGGGKMTEYKGGTTSSRTGSGTVDYLGGNQTIDSGSSTTGYVGGETETPSTNRTVEHQVSADNTGTYFPSEKDIETGATVSRTYSADRADTTTTGNTQTVTYQGRRDASSDTESQSTAFSPDRKDIETSTGTHSGRVHGNIGVTTSQQMLESERDVARYQFYAEAALLYASHLLIMVY